MLRAWTSSAKIGRDGVLDELQKAAGTVVQAYRPNRLPRGLDFAETGRGGVDVLLNRNDPGLQSYRRPGHRQPSHRPRPAGRGRGASEPDRHRPGPGAGLDYYTGIVFETTVKGWEKFGSVASGGRYDNLASLFTPRLPGVGASIGLDRLLALLDEAGWLKSASTTTAVLVANFPGTDPIIPFRMAARLRLAGLGTEVYPEPIQIGKQMGYGSSRGHRLAVIVGPDEAARRSSTCGTWAPARKTRGSPGRSWKTRSKALEIIEQEGPGS